MRDTSRTVSVAFTLAPLLIFLVLCAVALWVVARSTRR